MRIELDNPSSVPPMFVIPLDEEPTRSGVNLNIRGGKYDNRVALHRWFVDPLGGNEFAPARPCGLKAPSLSYTGFTAQLGLLPDPRCRFKRLRVEVILGEQVTVDELRPVISLLWPATARDKFKRVRSIETRIGLSVHVEPVRVDAPSLNRGETIEVEAAQIAIIAFGMCSPRAVWDFKATEANPELAGDFVVHLVAATIPGVASSGEIFVGADIEDVREGLRMPFFSRRSQAAPSTARFELTHA